MSKMIDTPQKLSTSQITGLVKVGVTHVGRYLGSSASWKSISKSEADALKLAGLNIISILEKSPTKVGYFTATQGKRDAIDAYNYAQAIGQPTETAIYFTVDYDAQPSHFEEILIYFRAVKENLKGYVVGAYGSYSVLNFLHSKNAASYYMQTLAWSGGRKCTFINIYQSTNDKRLNGIAIDDDILMTADVGAWGKPKPVELIHIPPIQTISKAVEKWTKIDSVWYYFENGKKRVGWLKDGDKWYYLDEKTGAMCVGWKQVAGKWYFFDVHGVMELNAWVTDKGKKYYVNDKGQMLTGQQTIEGKVYHFDVHGALIQ